MNHQVTSLAPGLYLVSTPIGTARDITLRALDTLASADVLAAEDTRSLRRLMDIHGVSQGDRPLLSYHDHSGGKARAKLLEALGQGKSVAYASEAGTPLIADPGYDLSREAAQAGHLVTAAPGASAVLTSLTLAGLPTDTFLFAGFLPNAAKARQTRLRELAGIPATLVIYESPKRITASLADMAEVFGPDRPAALCRELTKKFEDVRRGTLEELKASQEDTPARGEIVMVIDRSRGQEASEEEIKAALVKAMLEFSVKDAAEMVSKAHGIPRRAAYQMALALGKDSS